MEASEADVFSNDNAGQTDEGQAEVPEQTASESSDTDTPDLSEQEQALAAKIGDVVTTNVTQKLAEQQQSEPEPDSDFFGALAGEEESDDDQDYDDQGYDEGYDQDYGYDDQQQQGQIPTDDPILQNPHFQTLAQQNQQLAEGFNEMRELWIQQEEEKEREALNAFADEHPDIRKPEVLEEVKRYAVDIAERARDPRLRTNPKVVAMAYKAVLSDRAASARTQGGESSESGASLEMDAGASTDSSPDESDRFWSEIMESGGEAFPS